MTRIPRLVALSLVPLAMPLAVQPTAAQPEASRPASLEGSWTMTWATSTQRTRGGAVEVLEEAEARLRLTRAGTEITAEWVGTVEWPSGKAVEYTVLLRGEFTDERLVLRPVEVTAPGQGQDPMDVDGMTFVGFHIEGRGTDEGLAGEMWSLLETASGERDHGPLPWRARRAPEREGRPTGR